MTHAIFAIVATVIVWWLSTGAVLLAARRATQNRTVAIAGATIVALVASLGLYISAGMPTTAGVFIAFLSALGVWAWCETTFLVGAITGPRRTPCPQGVAGWARFRAGFEVVRDHEFAILAAGLLVVALTYGGVNQAGLWTFAILWAMRISAKINIFLGAPNSISVLVPPHLAYVTTYYRTDRVSPLFFVSVMLASLVAAGFVFAALQAGEPYQVAQWTLLATFLGLAIVEHFFLVLPVSDAALWSWATDKTESASASVESGPNDNVVSFPRASEQTTANAHTPNSTKTDDRPARANAGKGGASWI